MKMHSFKIRSPSRLASFHGVLVAMLLTLLLAAVLLLTALFSYKVSAQAPPPPPAPPPCVPDHLIGVWSVYLFAGSHTSAAGYLYCNLTITTGGVLYTPNPADPSRCAADYDPLTPIPITAADFSLTPDCTVQGSAQTTYGFFIIDNAQMTMDHQLILGVGRDSLGVPQTFQAVRQPQS